MPTSTSKIYDTIVIGAGIAGSSIAYALGQRGQSVLLADRSSAPASGGSGAAGAFVSPKIGKGGPLQELTNEAFGYAQKFYAEHFPEYFVQSGVVRIPRDDEDAAKFPLYEPHNYPVYEKWDADRLKKHGITDPNGGFYFPQAGDCDAPALVGAMAEGIDFVQFDVGGIERVDRVWKLHPRHSGLDPQSHANVEEILGDRGKYPWVQAQDDDDRHPRGDTPTAQNIVLATGYQNDLFDMRYMGIKGLWGSRGDYRTDADMSVSLHKNLSISSSRSGIVKIGATHVKHPNPCMVCDGRPIAGLFDGASELVDTEDFILKETFCGMRSGSRDYFPVVGSVIDVRHMLEEYPDIVRGAKPAPRYLPNVFVLNGLGGRGFVWAPIMAHWLAEHIINGANVSHSVHPDRLFLKWARKLSLT